MADLVIICEVSRYKVVRSPPSVLFVCEGSFRSIVPFKEFYPRLLMRRRPSELLTLTSGLDPFIPNRDQLDARQLKTALEFAVEREARVHSLNLLLLGFG